MDKTHRNTEQAKVAIARALHADAYDLPTFERLVEEAHQAIGRILTEDEILAWEDSNNLYKASQAEILEMMGEHLFGQNWSVSI